MSKIGFEWIWSKRWFLYIFGPILAGIVGFCGVVVGIDFPNWLFFVIIIISVPLSFVSVILGWIYVFRTAKKQRGKEEAGVIGDGFI